MKRSTARRVLGTVALFVAVSGLAACSSDKPTDIAAPDDCKPVTDVKTIEDGVLTVAAAEAPPVVDLSDGFGGFEPALIQKFAEENCLGVEVKAMSFAASIPAVQTGRADVVVGGYYRTAERAEVVSLSDPVWLDKMGIFSKDEISTIDDLAGHKVGTVDGYLWVPDLQEVLGSDLTVYPSVVELYADLQAGRVDVAIDSTASGPTSYKGFPGVTAEPDTRVAASVEPAQVGFPFAKDNPSLTEALNDAIARWHEDGTIADVLSDAGLDPSLAEVGDPRLIQ